MTVVLGIGTVKGAWFAQSTDRRRWTVSGPVLRGWEVGAFGRAPGGDYLVATGSTWYGAAIRRSRDRERWTQVVAGPSHGDPDRPVDRIWTLERSGDHLYAGVAHAGLFRSDDDGEHWSPVDGLNDHETRPAWQPGLGGLALHHIVIDPLDASGSGWESRPSVCSRRRMRDRRGSSATAVSRWPPPTPTMTSGTASTPWPPTRLTLPGCGARIIEASSARPTAAVIGSGFRTGFPGRGSGFR